jgi:striatin 1/3/4
MNPSGEQCYSGGLDSIIAVWNIPNSEVDPYDAYGIDLIALCFHNTHCFFYYFKDSNVLCKVLDGHTDAVWQLVISGQKLLSCSADGSVRLWDPNLTEPLQSTFNSN